MGVRPMKIIEAEVAQEALPWGIRDGQGGVLLAGEWYPEEELNGVHSAIVLDAASEEALEEIASKGVVIHEWVEPDVGFTRLW